MAAVLQVDITAGVPTSGTGQVMTLDAIAALLTNATSLTLLTNRSTDGADAVVDWLGGPGLISVWAATWGTATVQIAFSPNAGTTYIDSDGVVFSAANATLNVSYPIGKLRATVATAGGGTSNINAKIQSTR